MEIFIGKDGQVFGPFREAEIQELLDEGACDGEELACRRGMSSWVNVKELLEGAEAPAPEPEEASVEPESSQEPEPLDEETLGQINKIKELISDGHADTAWQHIQSLNNPRIYEGLLWDCPLDNGWVIAPEYLRENGDLFIKLLAHIPQKPMTISSSGQLPSVVERYYLTRLRILNLSDNQISDVTPLKNLAQLTHLSLNKNQISDVTPLKNLTQLRKLYLRGNRISKSDIEDLREKLPDCDIARLNKIYARSVEWLVLLVCSYFFGKVLPVIKDYSLLVCVLVFLVGGFALIEVTKRIKGLILKF